MSDTTKRATNMKNILSNLHRITRSKSVGLLALNLFLVLALLFQVGNDSSTPGTASTFAQGRIGLSSITLGNASVHPISAIVTDKAPVCLVLIAVEMQWPTIGSSDGGIFLLGDQRAYPAVSVHPIGQDAPFGQHKIRAYSFNPTELCQQDELKIEDLALMVVRPEGIGIVSFAAPHTIKASSKSLE